LKSPFFISSHNEVQQLISFLCVARENPQRGTSNLEGLWIGAAISNTSHSNKAGYTTVKRARLTGKRPRSTAVLL